MRLSEPAPQALLLALALSGCAGEDDAGRVRVWITELGAGRVSAWDAGGGGPAVRSGVLPFPGAEPSAIALDGGDVLVADFATGRVLALPEEGGEPVVVHDNATSDVRIEEPCALSVRGRRVLVLGNDTRNLVELGPRGRVWAELGLVDPLTGAHGFDLLDPDTVVVGTERITPGAGLARLWDLREGQLLGELARPPEVLEATDVTLLPDGRLAITDWMTGRVTAWDLDDGELVDVLAEGLEHPVAAALGPDGALLVLADDGVWRLGDDGPDLLVAPEQPLAWPRDLAVEPR